MVGAGALGFHHVRILREMEGATFVGFHDARPERADQVAASSASSAFADVDIAARRV